MVVDGRVVILRRDPGPKPPPAVHTGPVDALGMPLALPVIRQGFLPTESGDVWRDPADGTVYRVVQQLAPDQGWAASHTVCGWYKDISYARMIEMVQRGMIDAVVLRGSTTRRYRVLDHAKCLAYLAHPAESAQPAVSKPKRAKKGLVL